MLWRKTILAVFFLEGIDGKTDEFAAVRWLEAAAKNKYPSSMLLLGMAYMQGNGVPQDVARGFLLIKGAAELGNHEAQNNLAVCYTNGYGVEANSALAFKWYETAAISGYAIAQNNLGDCYFNGVGCKEDKYEAVRWYRRAAFQGDVSAQSNLGYCYLEGIGIGKSAAGRHQMAEKSRRQRGRVGAKQSRNLLRQFGGDNAKHSRGHQIFNACRR